MPNLGDRATCAACQQPIEWRGRLVRWLERHRLGNMARLVLAKMHPIAVELPFKRRMSADEYQQQAARTLIAAPDAEYTNHEIMLVWNALGLAGEAGEVADTVKKAVFHQHGLNRDELIKELGDVLWYVAALCSKLDTPLSEVMERNIAKLKKRYPQGYSADASKVRADLKD